MSFLFFYILMLIFTPEHSKTDRQNLVMTGSIDIYSSPIAVKSQPAAKNNAIQPFGKINEDSIVLSIYKNKVRVDSAVGYVFYSEKGDSIVMNIQLSEIFEMENDTVYLLKLFGGKRYDNCTEIYDFKDILLRKENKGWVFVRFTEGTDWLIENIETRTEGPYFIVGGYHGTSACGGSWYAGNKYTVYYGSSVAGILWYTTEEDNFGWGCREANEECACEKTIGIGNIRFDKKRKLLVCESEQTNIYYSGKNCVDSTLETTKYKAIIYKYHQEKISEIKISGGKENIILTRSIDDFIRETDQ